MKAALWNKYAKEYLIPQLPGSWKVSKGVLRREPTDWILCGLSVNTSNWSSDYKVHIVVQLLAFPIEFPTGIAPRILGHGTVRRLWKTPADVAEAESEMREILDLIRIEALPEFDRLGTIPQYAALAKEIARRDPQDPNYHEQVFCVRLLQGDIQGAERAADAAVRAAEVADVSWAAAVAERVTRTMEAARRSTDEAIGILRENRAYTCRKLGLPAASRPDLK